MTKVLLAIPLYFLGEFLCELSLSHHVNVIFFCYFQASTPVVISSGDEAQVTSTTNTISSATLAPNGGIVTVLLTPSTAIAIPAVPYRPATSSVGAQVSSSASPSPAPSPASSQSKEKSRKKSKAKATSKPRTIKFHEYKVSVAKAINEPTVCYWC